MRSTLDSSFRPNAPAPASLLKDLVGAGDRLMLFALPFVVAGFAARLRWPGLFELDLGTPGTITGVLLLVLGVPIWLSAAVQVLIYVPRGELITRGPFALLLHPIYTSVALLVLPGAGLLFGSWLGIFLGATLYMGQRLHAPAEERALARQFPERYPAYRRRVWLPWL